MDDQPSQRPVVADPVAYKDLLREVLNKIRASKVIDSKTGTMAVHGTAIALEALGKHGALPTRNHTFTMHPRYQEMGGRALTEKVLVDRMTCTRCPVRCRRVTASGGRFTFHVEGPDYAQLCAFGPNCDLVDVEAVSYMNYLCYDFGLDPIEMGNTIAMLAEATERGFAPNGVAWGDADRFRDADPAGGNAGRRMESARSWCCRCRQEPWDRARSPCPSRASQSRTLIRGRSLPGAC